MANITVVSTTNSIKVDFGVLSSVVGITTGCYNKSAINHISYDGNTIFVYLINNNTWKLDFNGTNGFQVDSVNSATPTDNADLYQKLITLIE